MKALEEVCWVQVVRIWIGGLLMFGLSVAIGVASTSTTFDIRLAEAATERTMHKVRYDPSYRSIAYPMGDVPSDVGVCTDVVIRAYRALGVDLQELVHIDMLHNFDRYPSKRIWGLNGTDRNIDHRRVPNLRVFFARHGQSLGTSNDKEDYRPGDVVTWMTSGNLPHIGIVVDSVSAAGVPLIAHNIGAGPKIDDMLFDFEITGHYRYQPAQSGNSSTNSSTVHL